MFRRADAGSLPEIVLVGRIRPRRWALPKGTPEAGETIEVTAVREVGEETGLAVRVVERLDEIQYWFVWGGTRHYKIVHFYLMEAIGGNTDDHDAEYDLVEWFPIGEALRKLSYPNEARIVERAHDALTRA